MSVKHLSLLTIFLFTIVVTMGCGPANSASSPVTAVPARRANYLGNPEIITAHADVGTAYDAIARLRPNWLASHGVSTFERVTELAFVFVNGQQYGGLSSLQNIPAYQIADMRYYDVTEAGARFGIKGGTGGVIEIRLK